MKTMTNENDFKRVKEERVQFWLNKGWKFCPKSLYKASIKEVELVNDKKKSKKKTKKVQKKKGE